MDWLRYLIGAVIGGGLFAGVYAAWPEAPQGLPPVTVQEEVARQTALLARIVEMLERWEAEELTARAAAEESSRRVMQGWRPGETHGRKELPKTFEGQR